MNHNSRGLTFVEILVGLALLSILTLSMYIVFKSGYDSWTKSDARLEIYQNARVAMDMMFRELAQAVKIGVGTEVFQGKKKSIWFIIYVEEAGRYDEVMYLLKDDILVRRYETNADYDETTFDMDAGTIIETPVAYNLDVGSVEFRYWENGSTDVWEGSGGATTESLTVWQKATGDPRDDLPRAVRISLGFNDADETTDKVWPFRTVVYLPNS